MIHDEEEYWDYVPASTDRHSVYKHKELEGVYRVIDHKEQTIRFSDINRIASIRDINKVLTGEDNPELNRKKYLPILNNVLDNLEPISMPYMRSEVIAYIEAFPGYNDTEDDVLGILYFRDKGITEDQDHMIPAKMFYRILPIISECRWEEIDKEAYVYLKKCFFRRNDNVDQKSDERTNKS